MQDQLKARAALVRSSGLFNAAEYPLRGEALLRNQDPVEHYLLHGEARGARPSSLFDPAYYAEKQGIRGDSPLIHYLLLGRQKGLRTRPVASEFNVMLNGFRPGFQRVVVVLDWVSSGSFEDGENSWLLALPAILDIVLVVLAKPEHALPPELGIAATLMPQIRLPADWTAEAEEARRLVRRIVDTCSPQCILFSGDEALGLIRPFSRHFLPTVVVANAAPTPATADMLTRTLGHTSCYIFPSSASMEHHVEKVPTLRSRMLAFPTLGSEAGPAHAHQVILNALKEAGAQMDVIAADHALLMERPHVLEAIAAGLGNPDDIQSRVLENVLVRGRDTGPGPITVAPKLFLSGEHADRLLEEIQGDTPVAELLRKLALQASVRRNIRAVAAPVPPESMRVALHGHYYHPELLAELLESLACNRHSVDLFLSTDTDAKRAALEHVMGQHGREAEIRVVPNRGRDVAPLFTGFRDLFEEGRYDAVGHVHSKKSLRISPKRGDAWRKALLQGIVGGRRRMMDMIISHMKTEDCIGLVFPEISNFCVWDNNYALGVELSRRMGLATDVSRPFFDYPAGMFFWARPRALRPLLDLNLRWEDYPAEPIPDDGTLAHAIERLLPFICESQGFEYLTTSMR